MNNLPLVDPNNPFYCPEISVSVYADLLRHRLHHGPSPTTRPYKDCALVNSFARLMDQALFESKHIPLGDLYTQEATPQVLSGPSSVESLYETTTLYDPPAWDYQEPPSYQEVVSARRHRNTPAGNLLRNLKRKESSSSDTDSTGSFGDLKAPIKRFKSSQSIHDSSFELSTKGEQLDFFLSGLSSGPFKTKISAGLGSDFLGTASIISNTPNHRSVELRSLIIKLDSLLPGTRLKETFLFTEKLKVQDIANFLALSGNLNEHTLEALRETDVQYLFLSQSLNEANGLNLGRFDVLKVFEKPDSFSSLIDLSMNDVPVADFEIVHLHHLRRLESLNLGNTGIGNEAICHLVCLKKSLKSLRIDRNPQVDDDAVSTLLFLTLLEFLSILDTGIGMPGLRRIAMVVRDEKRGLDVEIPTACEEYIQAMGKQYMVNPRPPLIVSPSACVTLSLSALKHNLSAHAAFNPNISTAGSKKELVDRLVNILETRKMDVIVRELAWDEPAE